MKSVLILLISLVFSASAHANEKLTYSLKVMGADFGTATVYTGSQKILAGMKANEKWASIYNVDNKIASVTNLRGAPRKTEYTYSVNGKAGHREITFGNQKIRVKKSKGNRVYKSGKSVHDPITWLMRVRTKLSEGAVGELTFDVFSGARFYTVLCYPLPVQTINTALGEKLTQPYLVKVTRKGGGFKREMTMWFNLDSKTASFEPLRAVGKFKLGHAEANLVSIEVSN